MSAVVVVVVLGVAVVLTVVVVLVAVKVIWLLLYFLIQLCSRPARSTLSCANTVVTGDMG